MRASFLIVNDVIRSISSVLAGDAGRGFAIQGSVRRGAVASCSAISSALNCVRQVVVALPHVNSVRESPAWRQGGRLGVEQGSHDGFGESAFLA